MRGAPLSRALVIAVAVGGVLIVPSGQASAASQCLSAEPCIAVHLKSGLDFIRADEITSEATAAENANAANAVVAKTYLYTDAAGGTTVQLGLSVNALLKDLMGSAFANVDFAELVRPSDGSIETLSAGAESNLSVPSNYHGGENVLPPSELGVLPAFQVNGTEIDYYRPLIDDSDSTPADDVQTAEHGAFDLYVYTGPHLTVTDHPSATKVKVGSTVTFTAGSSGDPNDITPRYSWTVNQDPKPSGRVLSETFTTPGFYEVLVRAAGSDDSAGAADPVFVNVGGVKPSSSPTPGTSPTATPHPTGTPTTSPRPTSTTTPSRPAPTPTRASPAPGSSNGRPGGAAPSAQPATGHPSNQPDGVVDRPVVRGRLIGQTVALLTAPAPVVNDVAAAAEPTTRLSPGWRAVTLAGSIAAIMLLFVAGAARELRWSRRPRSGVRQR